MVSAIPDGLIRIVSGFAGGLIKIAYCVVGFSQASSHPTGLPLDLGELRDAPAPCLRQ